MGKGIIKENRGGGQYYLEIVYDRTGIDDQLAALAKKKAALEDKLYRGTRQQDTDLRVQITIIDKWVATLNEKVPANQFILTYCADFTDDLQPGDQVGTIEFARTPSPIIKDGQNLFVYNGVLIRPGYDGRAVYNASRDGILASPLVQSPWGMFFNLAIEPAAMKWKPRYRWGVITDISGDYCDVELKDLTFVQEDNAQIDIDQNLTLRHVQIEYMTCNGAAFLVDDEVVVEFVDQDWSKPKVIGFTGDPAECDLERIYSVILEMKRPTYFNPSSISEMYQKLYFRLEKNGDITWIDGATASSTCRLNDCWSETRIRPFNFYYRMYEHMPFASGNAPDKLKEYSALPIKLLCPEEDIQPFGVSVPANWGVFEKIYSTGRDLCRPQWSFIYPVGTLKVNIWYSTLAIGANTKGGSAAEAMNTVRRIETDTRKEYTDGCVAGQFAYVTSGVGPYSSGTAGSESYSTNCYDNFPDFLVSSYNPALGPAVTLASIRGPFYGFFGGGSQYYFTAYFTVGSRSVHTYECNKIASVQILIVPSDKKWEWGTFPPPKPPAPTWTNNIGLWFKHLTDDGAFEAYVRAYYKSYGHGIFGLDNTENAKYTTEGTRIDYPIYKESGSEYRCPCDEFIGYPDDRSNPTYRSGTLETPVFYSSGTLKCGGGRWGVLSPAYIYPKCENIWSNEVNDEDPPEAKEAVEFPVAVDFYSEGQDIIESVDYFYQYLIKKSPSINQIFYRPQGDNYRLVVNFRQQDASDGANYVENSFVVIMNKTTGDIVSSNLFYYWFTIDNDAGDVDITLAKQSIFPRNWNYSKFSSALLARKLSVDAAGGYGPFLLSER